MDSLVISQTNKYLTHLFDPYMYNNSFAFRYGKILDGKRIIIRHHHAFKEIIKYCASHRESSIFVAECDMKKFFDSVNHKIVWKQFQHFIWALFKTTGRLPNLNALIIMKRYLSCYTFPKCVYKHNNDQKHFDKFKIDNGKYEWVEKDIHAFYSEKEIKSSKIGIPQGGALSGFIANIVLHYADEAMAKLDDGELLYLRYCDDMIIMHPDKDKCEKAFYSYIEALKKLKLFPHEPDTIDPTDPKSFWKSKTKAPYLWDTEAHNWITFVGYDISKNGDIRIRKKSFKKELIKQEGIIDEVLKSVIRKGAKVNKERIIESATNRLIGMSVGRLSMRTYKTAPPEMSWVNGFQLLNDNKVSRYQLKMLDQNRNRQIKRLIYSLNFIPIHKKQMNNKKKSRQIIYYGKPFSYYYSVIEKNKNI